MRKLWKTLESITARKALHSKTIYGSLLREKYSSLESFFCPYLSEPGLNMEIYCVNFSIQSEYRKLRNWKNTEFEHFSCSACDGWKQAISQLFSYSFSSPLRMINPIDFKNISKAIKAKHQLSPWWLILFH